ncbi:hypothetical protein NQZ68_035498 [Dissostichus eleginoides]|nr:hypothetical protein NQZ68_035498 [Dissostichus eleginoides]
MKKHFSAEETSEIILQPSSASELQDSSEEDTSSWENDLRSSLSPHCGPDPQCPLHFQRKGQRNSKKCWTPESILCQTPPRTLCLLQLSPAARWQMKATRLFLKSLLH